MRSWDDAQMVKMRELAQKTWEDWSKKTPLAKQPTTRNWRGSRTRRRCMTDAGGRRHVPEETHGRSALAGFCAAIDRLNTWVARFWGASIVFVTFAILYEVVARGLFGQATVWANETTVYLSAVAYLLGGGYALLRRGHVRIDLIYGVLPPLPA